MRVKIKGQINDMLQYEVTLPAAPALPNDIVKWMLTVTHGEVIESFDVTNAVDNKTVVVVPDEVDVTLSLAYHDDQDNISAPRVQVFHSHDSIAPDAPGDFGPITLIGETF